MRADIHRPDSSDPDIVAGCHVGKDRARFVAFVGLSRTSVQSLLVPLLLTGLDVGRTYEVPFWNPEDAPPQSRGPAALKIRPSV